MGDRAHNIFIDLYFGYSGLFDLLKIRFLIYFFWLPDTDSMDAIWHISFSFLLYPVLYYKIQVLDPEPGE
jgi:hypothetical protein